jgi:hypothetical protein
VETSGTAGGCYRVILPSSSIEGPAVDGDAVTTGGVGAAAQGPPRRRNSGRCIVM